MLHNCATSCEKVLKAAADDKEIAGITSFFDLSAKDIHGKMIDFSQFRGKGKKTIDCHVKMDSMIRFSQHKVNPQSKNSHNYRQRR
jgi:hypothetical protein